MERRSVIDKISYPNGKIYIGQDVTDTLTYFGSVDSNLVAADFDADARRDFTVRKQILWAADTATRAEVNARERELIFRLGSNDPAVGYNRSPRFKSSVAGGEGSAEIVE